MMLQRSSWRRVFGSPWYAVPAALAAGLGIGANAAAIYVVMGSRYPDLPYRAAGRLVAVENTGAYRLPTGEIVSASLSIPNYDDLKRDAKAFAALGAVTHGSEGILDGLDRPRLVCRQFVTAGLLEALGLRASTGRLLDSRDFAAAAPVALLTHRNWQRLFGADTQVVGRVLSIDGRAVEIVGVLPPLAMAGLRQQEGLFPENPTEQCVVLPLAPGLGGEDEGLFRFAQTRRDLPLLQVFARLHSDTSLAASRAETRHIAERLAQAHPATNEGRGLRVTALGRWRLTDARMAALGLVLAAGGLVYLAAFASVTGLVLTDGMRRRTELATRRALGAGALKVSVELMGRAAAWSLPGALLALGPSLFVLRWFGGPGHGAPLFLLWAASCTLLWVVAVGVAGSLAAWQLLRHDLVTALKGSGSPSHQGAMASLASLHVAVAVALLFSALLLNRSLANILSADPGYDPSNALAVQMRLPSNATSQDQDQRLTFLQAVLSRVRLVRGVESAGLTTGTPLSRASVTLSGGLALEVAGGGPPVAIRSLAAHHVTPGYVETLGVHLLHGRDLSGDASSNEILVDDTFARRFAVANPLAAKLRIGKTVYGVVGVVRATQDFVPLAAAPTIYLPLSKARELPWVFIAVRARGPLHTVGSEVVRAIQTVDPAACLDDPVSLASLFDSKLRPKRRLLRLSSAAAFTALALSFLSLFLVLQHVVVARRRDIAIRMAHGMSPSGSAVACGRLLRRPLVAGALLGGLGGYALARSLAPQLHQVSASDPTAALTTFAALCAVALAAALKPTADALGIDIAKTLREA